MQREGERGREREREREREGEENSRDARGESYRAVHECLVNFALKIVGATRPSEALGKTRQK